MRILYLTNESYLSGPIIQSQVVNLLERVARDDGVAAITLLTCDACSSEIEERSHGSPKIRHLLRRTRGRLRDLLWLGRYAFAHRHEYDVLHVRSYPPMLAALPARLLFGKRLIFDPRGLLPEELSYPEPRRLLTFVCRQVEAVSCRAADAIVAVSDPMRRCLLTRHRLDGARVRTISTFSSMYQETAPTAVPDVRGQLGWSDRPVFVYSGSMEPWQRLADVVRFFAAAQRRLPAARLLVLSKQQEEFRRYLSDRLPPDAFGVMSAPSKELAAYLAQCDYGVLFREDHLLNRVSAPIKVKDYLIAGLPVVMNDHIGDSSAFVREHGCGIVLDELTDGAMAAGVEEVVARHGGWARTAIADLARRTFDVEAAAASYLDLYSSLMASRATSQ